MDEQFNVNYCFVFQVTPSTIWMKWKGYLIIIESANLEASAASRLNQSLTDQHKNGEHWNQSPAIILFQIENWKFI